MLDAFLQKVAVFENSLPLMAMVEKAVSVTAPLSSVDLNTLGILEGIDSSAIDSRFVGKGYQRIILSLNMAEEDQSSFDYVTLLESQIKKEVTGAFHIISRTSAVMEIKDMSDRDYVITTIISILAVFLIIMLSFRSLVVPIILIILIEGAVFINMAIPALSHEPLIFMGYIIVSCLQLGATIDYAILITHRYRENRRIHDQKQSMFMTIDESFGSIVTSGLILTVAGFILALVSRIPVIASMGRLIGFAGAISMTLVLIALPQVLYLSDGWVNRHFKINVPKISNPV
jgi:predicted RND superfamily exporter protein